MRASNLFYALILTLGVGGVAAAADTTPIQSYQFPALVEAPVPTKVLGSLEKVKDDLPKPYHDRCHVQQNQLPSGTSCIYANPNATRTIVLFGDSHALSWFPAIEKLALAKHWRFLSLTMSSCWPANIPAWNPNTESLMENCTIWRKAALKEIYRISPYITFVTGTRGFATTDESGTVLTGDARTKAWITGMKTTLKLIKRTSTRTFLIGDTPISTAEIPGCLEANPESIAACGTPTKVAIDTDWLGVEQSVASMMNVYWADPTTWVCQSEPCSPIGYNKAIYRDGGHLTATYARYLEGPLWTQLSQILYHLPATGAA